MGPSESNVGQLLEVNHAVKTNGMNKQEILDQFNVDNMFDAYVLARGIDRRKTPSHKLIEMKRSFLAGVAHIIILNTALINDQKEYTAEQLMNSVLQQIEEYLKIH